MGKGLIFALTALCSMGFTAALSQEKRPGPVIEGYGAVWDIPGTDYPTDTNAEFKVVFDVMNSPESPSEINKTIETAARFLNMHVRDGVPREQLHVALVVHNKATKDIITNEAYRNRYGVDNPNAGLVRSLLDQGVAVILCGQSSYSRNFPMEITQEGVQLALSAMTAIIQLRNEGYVLIKF